MYFIIQFYFIKLYNKIHLYKYYFFSNSFYAGRNEASPNAPIRLIETYLLNSCVFSCCQQMSPGTGFHHVWQVDYSPVSQSNLAALPLHLCPHGELAIKNRSF